MTEAEITKRIRQFLNVLNVWHWKQWQGPMSQPQGVSDILGIWNGKFLAIEVKTERGNLSDHQKRFIDMINREGGIAFVARSVDDVIIKLGVQDRFLT